jgi:aminoglycoside/choline kinase family phosphotransferase
MPDTVPHLRRLLDATFRSGLGGQLTRLKGEISTRVYYRFRCDVKVPGLPETLIVMRLPEEPPDGPSRPQARAFVDVQRFLLENQIPAPRLYAEDIGHDLLLLEDLGDESFESRLHALGPARYAQSYDQAIDLLVRIHALADRADPSACIALRRRYEPSLIRWELDHFREWGIEARSAPLSAAERSELDAHFDVLTAEILALPSGLVHRDYQSRNLIWATASGALSVIDFQDAFIGPAPYDLVALLCDSYVALEPQLQAAMLQRYAAGRGLTATQASEYARGFRLLTVQRKLKDAGRFVFFERVRGNADFLPFYPSSLRHVARALAELPQFAALLAQLRRLVPEFER